MTKKRLILYFSFYLVITLIALFCATLFSSKVVRNFYYEQTSVDLETRAHLVAPLLMPSFVKGDIDELQKLADLYGETSEARLTIVDLSGKVVVDSKEHSARLDNHGERPEIKKALQGEVGSSIRFSYTLQKNLIYLAVPLQNENETIVGCLRVSVPVTSVDIPLNSIQNKIGLGAMVLSGLIALVTWFISRQISLPILAMRDGAKRFAAGDFSQEIPLNGPSEIIDLAGTLNRMARDLDKQIQTISSQRNELKGIFNSMVEGVFTVDTKERVTSINGAACDLFEVSPENSLGKTVIELVRNSDLKLFVQSALKTNRGLEGDITLTHSARGERQIQMHGTVLKSSGGMGKQVLLVMHDVTQLRKLEAVRKDFVANVSHELKTPITAIQGFVETLLDGGMEDPEYANEFLGIIKKQSSRLSAIIEDLLILSRIEQGKQNLELSCVALAPLIESVKTACEFRASEFGLSLMFECPENIYVKINKPLLELALVNLVDNGLKYSKGKGKSVDVFVREQGDMVFVEIKDEGEGIAKEHQARLFERFYRVDKARSRKQGGTGLGLSIVKHIIMSHSGSITVKSKAGQGSVFIVALPKCDGCKNLHMD